MANIFRRATSDVVADYRDDSKLVTTEKRMADLRELIAQATERARQHDPAIAAAARVVERRELEILAGAGADADLAVAQAAHLQTRRAKAIDLIQKEQASEELAKLEAALPQIRYKAQRAAQKALRVKYMAIATELAAALETAVQLDARLVALVQDASNQFGKPVTLADGSGNNDPALPQQAGFGRPYKTTLVNGMLGYTTVTGQSQQWLEFVRNGIEQVKALQEKHDK